MLSPDWVSADPDGRLGATLTYLDALTRRPDTIDDTAVDAALEAGVVPGALEQASLMVALFSYMNRMVDAFGADVTPEEAERIAAFLDRAGSGSERLGGGRRPWERLRGSLPDPLAGQLDIIRTGDGDCPVGVRVAIEARVAAVSGATRGPAGDLPPEVVALVDTLATDGHGVADAHIEALTSAGWSEEAIYEMVFVASFAAGVGRLERSLSVLADR
ncbi:MAG: hypothetical protein AB1Z57_12315 [Acidimicrobiia bacterium]